ncbi:MAG: ABC transporter permease, partial [Cyanobacteria bacterium P01_D01_bin.116]
MNDFFLIKYGPEIIERSGEHLVLVIIAIGIATLIGIPLGI